MDAIDRSCRDLLTELQLILDKNSELSSPSGNFRGKFARTWKRIKWDQEEINGLRNRLISNIGLLSAFHGRFTRDRVVRLVQHQEDQGHQAILDWFASNEYASQQRDVFGRRQAGTGQWLLDSPEFQTWFNTSDQILFCHGIPGAGKTVLSSVVVEDLKAKAEKNTGIGIAHFYFDFRRRDEQKPEVVFASLLRQLLTRHNPLPDYVKTVYDKHKYDQTSLPIDTLSKALHSVIETYSRIFIVVDALDECHSVHRANFLNAIFELRTKTGFGLFTTSRLIPEITRHFENHPSIEIKASEEDVRSYLKGHMSQLPSFVQRDPGIQEAIEMTIVKVVDGM